MRIATILLTAFTPFVALANEEWKVERVSFSRVGDINSRIGELCAVISGPKTEFHRVRMQVKVDPRTSRPGYYMSPVNEEGRFCLLAFTFAGHAEVAILHPDINETSSNTSVSVKW